MRLPHADLLDIDDFCPSQFYAVMGLHTFTIFVSIILGFYMGYFATAKILTSAAEMQAIYKFNFYLAFIAFNVVMVMWPLKIVLCMSSDSFAGFICQMISFLANMFIIIALVTTWIARIHIEFKGTIHEIKRWVYVVMLSFYSIGVIAVVVGQLGLTVSWLIDDVYLLDESAILILIACACYIILSAMFLWIFAKVLQVVNINIKQSAALQDNNPNSHSSSFNITENEIMDKTKKYLGLSVFGLVTAIISLLFKAIVIFFENYEFGIQLVAWINSVDSTVNFVALFLQFGFAASYYYYWCKCIDSSLGYCLDQKDISGVQMNQYLPTDNEDIDLEISRDDDLVKKNLKPHKKEKASLDSVDIVPSSEDSRDMDY